MAPNETRCALGLRLVTAACRRGLIVLVAGAILIAGARGQAPRGNGVSPAVVREAGKLALRQPVERELGPGHEVACVGGAAIFRGEFTFGYPLGVRHCVPETFTTADSKQYQCQKRRCLNRWPCRAWRARTLNFGMGR